MMKELFANTDAGLWGLFIFLGVFIVGVAWVFRPGSTKQYKDHAKIPLREDKKNDQ